MLEGLTSNNRKKILDIIGKKILDIDGKKLLHDNVIDSQQLLKAD